MNNWIKQEIRSLGNEVRKLFEPTSKSNLPYIGLEHIEQQTLRICGIGNSNEVVSSKKVFKSNDILFGTLRPYFRKVAKPSFDGVCSTDITVLRANKENCQEYFFYLISSQPIIDFATVASNGTKMPRAKWSIIAKEKMAIPHLPIQKKIAAILTAYDDLIENNNKRISILEKMAEEIYKEWFVRMRFPGYKKAKFVKGVPEGWIINKVKSVIDRKNFGRIYRDHELNNEGKIIVIDQSQKEFLGFYNGKPAHDASFDDPYILFGDHSCKMLLMMQPFSLAENVIPCKAKNGTSIFILYFLLKNLVVTTEYKRHWNELVNKSVYVPKEELQEEFGELIKPFFIQIKTFKEANLALIKTRDLLLPRILSGKLSVENLDIKFPPSMEQEDA